jgi:predicted metal-binding membrane protein
MNTKIEQRSLALVAANANLAAPVRRTLTVAGPAFYVSAALAFLASVAATIYLCRSMSGGMPMPGGWTMSMAWMKMPGQSWLGSAASFMAMWVAMMVGMMLPSLVPMLVSYRRSIHASGTARCAGLTMLVSAGYFFMWAIIGLAVYPLGVVMAAAAMRWVALARCVPVATGVVFMLAGILQLTKWKARQLERCRSAPACNRPVTPDAWSACPHGFHLGVDCALCCLSFTMILLAAGVMNLGGMATLAVAINMERLLPRPAIASRAIGLATMGAAILAIVRAMENLP